MRERLVRFCHAVHIFALLDRSTFAISGIHDFACQTGSHALLTTLGGIIYQPTHGQSSTTARAYFHRHLVRGTTDTTGFHFDDWANCIQRFFEVFHRLTFLALLDNFQSTVNDTLGDRLLAGLHNVVDKLGQQLAIELRIRKDLPLRGNATSWHDGCSTAPRL